jgi:hypothetical protein
MTPEELIRFARAFKDALESGSLPIEHAKSFVGTLDDLVLSHRVTLHITTRGHHGEVSRNGTRRTRTSE